MNKRSIAAVMILATALATCTLLSIAGLSALPIDATDFWMEPVSSRICYADCNAGDVLYGTFEVIQDGDLFPGDQTKYDIWLIQGVDFFIFDELNYSLWLEGSDSTAVYANNHISQLSWNITLPESGRWYVVYSNDSMFRKHVTVTTACSGSAGAAILVAAPVLVGCFLLGLLLIARAPGFKRPALQTGQFRR